VIAVVAYTQAPSALRYLGNAMVLSEGPEKADVIFVLGGDFAGHRVRKACELAAEGFAPLIWVSGPGAVFDQKEADLAVAFAQRSGCPEGALEPFYSTADSTREEALFFRERAAERGYRSYLLVTSNFHTRRAAGIFRKEVPGLKQIVISSPDPAFDPDHWWEKRPQRKTFFYESLKTVTGWAGI
jgi:uncharacterized SAM-binding protein YcdF (DUF218 family)